MTLTYEQIAADYPEYMSKEQMRIVCHISKKTARLLLQTGRVPCVDNGKKTRNYKIATVDVIEYLKQRDATPEKYILPTGRYAKQTSAIIDTDCFIVNTEDLAKDYEGLFVEYPDVLSVQQTAALADATIKTVNAWIRRKYLRAFIKAGAYYVPKLALIEYLSSPLYRSSPSGKRKYAENYCTISLD